MTLERAVHGWVAAATGLAAARVLWATQGKVTPRPAGAGAWVELLELASEAGGPDWSSIASNPLAFADLAVTAVDAGANTLTATAHGRATGDGPVQLETTGAAPGGLAVLTDYWLIRVDANTVQLAATFLNAMDGVAVDLTSAGTGAHTLVSTAGTLAAGAELLATTTGTRTVTVRVTAYGGTATGDTKPRAYLDRVRAAAALEGVQSTIGAEGAAIGSCGAIQDVSARIATVDFEPRAVMDVRLHLAAPAITETLTIIATATAAGTVT